MLSEVWYVSIGSPPRSAKGTAGRGAIVAPPQRGNRCFGEDNLHGWICAPSN